MLLRNFDELSNLPDLWEHLQNADKPIVLYGMGDGADKILAVCESKNIRISGVFASDGFVRHKTFHGFDLTDYATLRRSLGKCIILVSFATRLDNVMKSIYNLNETDELYAPDVPVFGQGIFDKSYFLNNAALFRSVYDTLSDDLSRRAYLDLIAHKITGKIDYLKDCETDVAEVYHTVIRPKGGDRYVDIGAYNGDTLREYVSFAGQDISAVCFEPDARNFKKLRQTAKELGISDISLHNAAAWDKEETLSFYARSGRASAHTTSHAGEKVTLIPAYPADSATDLRADYIKIDAEGADLAVVRGLAGTIRASRPVVGCAVYHRVEDLFALPSFLTSLYEDGFSLYIRHFPYIPGWDANVYIAPSRR